ncbi:ATP-binding protein [Kitasatospora sp. NPDC094028]
MTTTTASSSPVILTCGFLLARTEREVARGRTKVLDLLAQTGAALGPDTEQRVRTVASELITGAVTHAKGPYLQVFLYVDRLRAQLLIVVHDGAVNAPKPRSAGPDPRAGVGMFLTRLWSLAWGAENTTCGKRMWAQLQLPAQPISRRELLLGRRAALHRASRVRVRPAPPELAGRRAA